MESSHAHREESGPAGEDNASHQAHPERRAAPRYLLAARATLFAGATSHACRLHDISVRGARVLCTAMIREGQAVRLDIQGVGPVHAVVICTGPGSFGVAFDNADETRARIGEALEALSPEPAPDRRQT